MTGRSIGYTEVTLDEMRRGPLGTGLPADDTEFMLMLLGLFKAGYAERTTEAVARIVGREPGGFEQYALAYRAEWV